MAEYNSNEELIAELIEEGVLRNHRIIEAFRAIDRKDFVLPELRDEAYANEPLPIGGGQTISQPYTVAFMLELLDPEPGERILDIGSGSGWQAALLAYLVTNGTKVSEKMKKRAKVVTVERIAFLKEMAERNIGKYNFITKGVVEAVLGDGSVGYAAYAPYHKIISAAAAEEIPVAWKEELQTGGRIVAPLGGAIAVYERLTSDKYAIREYEGFRFVPLIKDSGGG